MTLICTFSRALVCAGVSISMLGGLTAIEASAQTLKVATAYKLMTLDPDYADLNENTSLFSHIFERLVYQDETMEPQPGLAKSWKRLSDARWEFKLREDVKFHDGSPFTSQDVVATVERIQHYLKPPSGGLAAYTQAITKITATDPHTVVFETSEADPTLPLSLASIFIVRNDDSGFKATDEMNRGLSVIGTGPYKFDSWQSGESLKLVTNDDYWGTKPAWSEVVFRIIESPPPVSLPLPLVMSILPTIFQRVMLKYLNSAEQRLKAPARRDPISCNLTSGARSFPA